MIHKNNKNKYKITESRLRKIIRSVIKEARATEDEDYRAQHRDLSELRNLKKYPPAWNQMFRHAKKCEKLNFSNRD